MPSPKGGAEVPSGVNAFLKVIGAICAVIGAIAATLEIRDHLQSGASSPPPAVEVKLPESGGETLEPTEGVASTIPFPEGGVHTETEIHEPKRQTPEPAVSKVEALINYRAVPSGSVPTMAIALDGDSRDVELMEAALAQGASSAELRLVPGFFKPAFRQRGYLRAVYDGDTEALTSSGALAAVGRILLGRVERACRATGQIDSDLITCDVGLYFKIFDRHGAIADSGHIAVAGAGFSEDAARDRAIEMLVQQHGKRIISYE
jgi:hypothetical protein